MSKRQQINIRSNAYTEALIEACLKKDKALDKSKLIHYAIEKLSYEIIGAEEVMNIRLYQQFKK